ncbi:MAG: prevent-host-death protein [Cyanobacteria bacterium RI_101]|nr:prevent-host-death protein [Cyanobacteria bacterium RI_101]
MKTINKNKLKENLIELLRLVEVEGEEILVTDGEKTVAKISQYQPSSSTEELFKDMRGKVQYFEDLTTPTTEEWTKT